MSILDEIFSKIQTSQTPQSASPKNDNLFKPEIDKTYIVRFVPYLPNPSNSMLSFMNHGWESRQNGRYISVPCLKSWGKSEICPCCETRFAELKIGTDAAKNKARLLRQKTMNYANIYIIESPNEKDIGQVKPWRYGAEIGKILSAAIVGEDSEEYGKRIFDLSPNGVDFRIRCEMKGTGKEATPTYVASKFISKQRNLNFTASEIENIYGLAQDLTTLLPPKKTADEIQKVLNEHYFTNQNRPSIPVISYANDDVDVDDVQPNTIGQYGGPPASVINTNNAVREAVAETQSKREIKTNSVDIDETVNSLLKEFEIPTF